MTTARARDRAIAAMVRSEQLLNRLLRSVDDRLEAVDARGEFVLAEPERAALRILSCELYAASLSILGWRSGDPL